MHMDFFIRKKSNIKGKYNEYMIRVGHNDKSMSFHTGIQRRRRLRIANINFSYQAMMPQDLDG